MRVWLWPAMSGKEFVKAAEKGKLDRVRELLAQRADVESRNPDHYNRTALIETGLYGLTDIAKVLLAAGANVNAADRVGKTALAVNKFLRDNKIISKTANALGDFRVPYASRIGSTAAKLSYGKQRGGAVKFR
eukprot:g76665.t1